MATRRLEVEFIGDTKSLERAFGRASKGGGRFGAAAKAAFLGIGTAAAGAGAKMISLASDAEETASKFRVVFGRETPKAIKQLDAFSKATGTSRFALREQAAQLQALIRPMGLSTRAAAGMSTNLTKLATDLASFNNSSVQEAMTALQSGLVGEAEPLRRFGVQLSAARVQAFAYAEGIAKQGKELTAAQKAQAAYGIILKDTKLAQGDAVRTADSFANQFKRVKSQVTDVATQLGVKMLPAVTDVVSGFSDFITQMESGKGAGGAVAAVIGDLARTASDAYRGVKDLVRGFQEGEAPARAIASVVGGAAVAFAAFKVGGTVIAGIDATKKAWAAFAGPNGVMAKSPVGVAAVAIAGLIGALGILSAKTRENEVSSRAFNDALRAQRDAMREVAGIELDEAQRRANLRSATLAVERAEKTLTTARKEHGRKSLEARQAEADLRQARISQRRAAVDVAQVEEDSKDKRDRLKEATKALTGEEKKLNREIDGQISDREKEIRGIDDSIQAVKRQGGNYDVMRGTVEKLRKRQRALRDEINALKSKRVSVDVKFKLAPSPGSVFGTGGVGDGWGVQDSIQALAQTSLDNGRLLSGASGSIAGTGLNAFNSFAQMFGLAIGSGYRPGSRTASGNLSYHALGRARDFPGTPAAMMGFAKFMASTFGSRLKELIYTPLGFSIKNGAIVPPYARADHFDHVHVAMRSGGRVPGAGPGDRVPALLEPGEFVIRKSIVDKFGPTFFNDVNRMKQGGIVQAAQAASKYWGGQNLVRAVAIAGAETGGTYNPRSHYVTSREDSRGPWQINVRAHPWAKRFGLYSFTGGARAAHRVWEQAGGSFSPWSTWPGKAGAYMGRARKAVKALGKKGGKPGTGVSFDPNGVAEFDPWVPPGWEMGGDLPSSGGGGPVDAPSGPDIGAQLLAVQTEIAANQRKLIFLAETQGPQVVGAVVAAVNGSIGGRVGLGFQGIRSAPGDVAGL